MPDFGLGKARAYDNQMVNNATQSAKQRLRAQK